LTNENKVRKKEMSGGIQPGRLMRGQASVQGEGWQPHEHINSLVLEREINMLSKPATVGLSLVCGNV